METLQRLFKGSKTKINHFFRLLENNFSLTLFFLFLLALGIRIFLTPYQNVLVDDAYIYLIKSLRITQGDFTPVPDRLAGWSFFLAPFLYFFRKESIFQQMIYARSISVFLGAGAIFPLAFLGKKLLAKRSLLIVLILFVFSPALIFSAGSAGAEPLFTLFLLLTLLFVFQMKSNPQYLFLASIFAALSFSVRPNGIFLLLIILVTLYFWRKEIPRFRYYYFLYTILIFVLLSSPLLYQRYRHFGSPFFYGENSKYLVDSYQEVWSKNIANPSLGEYLKTHELSDYLRKFGLHGFLGVVYAYIHPDRFGSLISPLLLPLFLYGILRFGLRRKFIPLTFVFIVWVLGLSLVFEIFSDPRHLYPTLPLVLLFSALSLGNIFKSHPQKNLLVLIFLLVYLIFSGQSLLSFYQAEEKSILNHGLAWGRWIAQNIQGRIAIGRGIERGGTYIIPFLPDAQISGLGMVDLEAPKSGISIVSLGHFQTLEQAMEWYHKVGVTHLAIDQPSIERRPFLRELYAPNGEFPPYLEEIYESEEPAVQWEMKIYSLDWEQYFHRQEN